MLVETDPIPHVIVDVRKPEDLSFNPLPEDLKAAVHIPAEEVEQALSRSAAGWRARAPSAPVPARDWLLVFVGDDADEMRAAAAGAATAGFERGAVLEGGLQAYGQAALQQANLKYIGRDGLALALGLLGERATRLDGVRVLDIRRHDERSLYGSIPGTVHVPTDQLPAALSMAPREWEAAYRCPKPGFEDWVVMQCRTNRRAAWAAQVAQDAGWPRVLVYRQGVYGWRVHPTVKAYQSYERGEPPPEPEPFQPEPLDAARAKAELTQLGIRVQ
ncbi:probable thiosulfate:glutathione sulfurtransferase at C-terminar half [Coccomyxa sp. Obi]|nr:probable thiosulfate:glutathione sulfurtransferase at C-terminar half [Coccomyxa sp. Obi]